MYSAERRESLAPADYDRSVRPIAIYLARQDFDVTGVDYARAAIDMAQASVAEAGVKVDFTREDLINLPHVHGHYEFFPDYSVLDDMRHPRHEPDLQNLLPLTLMVIQ